MKKSELIKLLNDEYDFNNQEILDNCGVTPQLLMDENITGIFISLDMNYDAYQKAIDNQCNVIITHHPILIDEEVDGAINDTNKLLIKTLQEKNITNIALHTCFDAHPFGSSYLIYLLLKNIINLGDYYQIKASKYLIFTELNKPLLVSELINKLKANQTYFSTVRCLNHQTDKMIKTICIGAGSCCGEMNTIIENKIDCFLTGDIKWHNYLDGLNNNLVMIDINHTTERVFIPAIKQFLNSKNCNCKIVEDYNYIVINNY